MIGDGVIAESVISYRITWVNPGNGEQPKWDQNKQKIEFHQSDIYPDLEFSKAQGLATYYTYTTIDSLVNLLKEINAIIDAKLGWNTVSEDFKQLGSATALQKSGPTGLQQTGNTSLQTTGPTGLQTRNTGPTSLQKINSPTNTQLQNVIKGQVPATIDKSEPVKLEPKDKVTIDKETTKDSGESEGSGEYTVIVYGEKLKFIDAQLSSASIRVRHKVSSNLLRKVNDEVIDNSKNIWVEIHTGIGSPTRMELKEFETEDYLNLLVQVLPTIDLILTAGEKAITPKSEETVNDEDRIRNLNSIRRDREEARLSRSKKETEQVLKRSQAFKK